MRTLNIEWATKKIFFAIQNDMSHILFQQIMNIAHSIAIYNKFNKRIFVPLINRPDPTR